MKKKGKDLKNIIGKNVFGLIAAIAILVLTGVIGEFAGVFDDIEGSSIFSFTWNGQAFAEILIALCFLFALKCIVNIVFGAIKVKNARSKTLKTIIASVIKYTIYLAGICWILSILGVNVSAIFASIGVLALIVGFGAESLVADVVTGLFILIENQFNVGDIIEVDGFRGTVANISIRTVSLRDAGGNVKIINNSDLSNVINRSNNLSVAVAEVGVSYLTDLKKFEKHVDSYTKEIKELHPDIFIGAVTYLGVEKLADSSVVLKFIAEVKEENLFTGMRLLNRELKCIFDRENVEIAYPQLDVHTK